MSALSRVLGSAIDRASSKAIRSSIGSPLAGVIAPTIEKAIGTLKNNLIGPASAERRVSEKRSLESAAVGDDLAGINARGDALQNWCWYALLPEIIVDTTIEKLPWYYVQTTNAPQRNIAFESVTVNGHPVSYPESYSVDQLQLGLFMDSTNKAHKWLTAWQSLILGYDDPSLPRNQGMWGLPASYKKDINIVLLNAQKQQMINFKYINCWPSAPTSLDLVSSSAEAIVQNVSFLAEDVSLTIYESKGLVSPTSSPGAQIGQTTGIPQDGINSALNKLGSSIKVFF